MQSTLSDFFELPQPQALFFVDVGFAVAGVFVLVKAAHYFRRSGSGLLSGMPEKPNTLWPEYIALPMLVYAALAVGLGTLLADVPDETLPSGVGDLLAGSLAQLLAGLACLALAARTFERRTAGFLFGEGGISKHAVVGLIGLLAVYPVCFAATQLSVLVIFFVLPGYEPPQHAVLELLTQSDTPGWVPVLLWVSAVVVAPFAEEVFFRGVCQTGLNHLFRRRMIPVVVVGVCFGLAHADQPQYVAPLIVLGLVLGYVYERTGSMVAPFTLHAMFNLKTMIFATLANEYVS